jgi:O-antigen ligase
MLTIPLVFLVMYGQSIKNGALWAFVLISIFLVIILKRQIKQIRLVPLITSGFILVTSLSFFYLHIEQNPTWKSLLADGKVAVQLEKFDHWKYGGSKGYPNNEFGKTVSITNYERIAWVKAGVELVSIKPLGYGLIENSFGYIAKEKYPDSTLTHSHSGWLDLALSLGLPGTLIIVLSIIISINNLKDATGGSAWWIVGVWGLGSLAAVFLTTELSNKVEFDQLIFWISFVCGLGLLPSSEVNRPKVEA